MKPKVSLRRALADRNLLGNALAGPSWAAWRVLLIAAAGERLTDAERAIFQKLTGRPREAGELVHEFVAIVGRRGGKSRAMATLLCWLAALCDYRGVLAPGETGVALLISRDQRAAKIILDYVAGIFDESPVLRVMVKNRTADSIELFNRISIEVRPCNRVSVRGPTYVCIVGDEVAHWFTSADFANPDVEIIGGAKPGLMTTRGPCLLVSSAYGQAGLVYDVYKKSYGPAGDPDILVAHGTSRDLNPLLPQAEIDRELERDAVRNRAEYLSEFRSDVEGFIGREVIEACVGDYRELEPRPGVVYFLFVDAASGTANGDSYALAISHKESDKVIVDCVREILPPFSPSAVVTDVALLLCKAYGGITKVWGDNYAGNYAKEPFFKAGIYYELWKQHKSELYRDPLLPAINSKKITLPRTDRLITQACQLERSVKRSGRDEISHPTHGHDDLINAVAGAIAAARAVLVDQDMSFPMPFVHSVPCSIPGGSVFAGGSRGGVAGVSEHSPMRGRRASNLGIVTFVDGEDRPSLPTQSLKH